MLSQKNNCALHFFGKEQKENCICISQIKGRLSS